MQRAISLSLFLAIFCAGVSFAQGAVPTGTWHPGGFPLPMGPTAQLATDLYNIIFIIIALVALVVALPIGYILWRFRSSRVNKAAKFSHSTTLELLWTIIPALICVYIMWASYGAMISLRTMPEGGVNVEAVAYQFGWDFYYPDASEAGVHVKAEAPSVPNAALSRPGAERLVPEMVVPVNRPIVLHVTSADVLHAFYNPHLGVKIDAIPGRINYAWFQANTPGTYLGQCAELCGSAHGEMFFNIRAVSEADYAEYLKARRVEAGLPAVHTDSPTEVISGTTPVAGSLMDSTPTTAPVPVSSTTNITPSVPTVSTGK